MLDINTNVRSVYRFPNFETDCYFAFGGSQGGNSLAAPGESSNESAGETLDVEGFEGSGGTGSLGLGAIAGGQQTAAGGGRGGGGGGEGATVTAQKPSRGIGIGIGVAAGAATAHRGMKRELSDSNLGGAASWDRNDSGWAGMGGDARRSMSEQQKLERRVSMSGHVPRCCVGCVILLHPHRGHEPFVFVFCVQQRCLRY